MIAVIADDFTGAAELAGICLRYHLTVELGTEVNRATKADVFIIATDCRSLKEGQAVAAMKKHTEALLSLHPAFIFKKTDSVLRGHILAEVKAQMAVTGYAKALLVAANPALGRTIQNGRYFLHNQPVHETSFSHDPDFPVTSSAVEDMLRANNYPVFIKNSNEGLSAEGITVGDVETADDLTRWANCMDSKTLPAGASGFFEVLLNGVTVSNRGTVRRATVYNRDTPGTPMSLFVCGTTFANSRNAIEKIYVNGGPVSYMPENINYKEWADEVCALIKKHGKAIVAIRANTNDSSLDSNQLKQKMACLVNEVLPCTTINELIIEGGATAWAVLQQSGLTQFLPVQELAPGVVRMQTGKRVLFVTVKPGSYQWPAGMWNF